MSFASSWTYITFCNFERFVVNFIRWNINFYENKKRLYQNKNVYLYL